MTTTQTQQSMVRKAVRSNASPWWAAWLGGLAFMLVPIGVLWATGMLKEPTDKSSSELLVAVLGVVGAALAGSVTVFAAILKQSLDNRSAAIAEVEKERAGQLAQQAEERNRTEVAIRAVDLIGENNANATSHQIGGALLALVSLKQHELAVSLLADLWEEDLVSPSVAGHVLERAFENGGEAAQRSAVGVLLRNAGRIFDEETHFWPFPSDRWPHQLSDNCRLGLVMAAAKWLVATVVAGQDSFSSPASVLFWALEDKNEIVVDIAACTLLPVTESKAEHAGTSGGSGRLLVRDVKQKLDRVKVRRMSGAAEAFESQVRASLATPRRSTPS